MRATLFRFSALLCLLLIASPLLGETLATVRVHSPQQPRGRPRSVFSASEILDLEFDARLTRRVGGEHQIEFRLYTPSGHLYQVLTAELSAASGPQGSPRGRRQASARLPVAGTSIVNSSLYGLWTVVAHLNGTAEPASRPRTFTIKQ